MIADSGSRLQWVRRASLLVIIGSFAAFRRPGDDRRALAPTFAAPGKTPSAILAAQLAPIRTCRTARCAYEAICRRYPQQNDGVQRFVSQSARLWKRQRNLPTDDKMEKKKAAYLAKLGLAGRVKDKNAEPAWHLEHMSEGEVFEGYFSHPDVYTGRAELTLTVTSPKQGSLQSNKAEIDFDADIRQDFPIAHEVGSEARNRDMAAYIFSKFNSQWRSFEEAYPLAEDLQYLSLVGLRTFFKQVAKVEDYPPESEFNDSCADPSKGMTLDEFLKYTLSEDPAYIEQSFPAVYTGRRVQFEGDSLMFDGDFVKDCEGAIFGYVSYKGKAGGVFELQLKGTLKES